MERQQWFSVLVLSHEAINKGIYSQEDESFAVAKPSHREDVTHLQIGVHDEGLLKVRDDPEIHSEDRDKFSGHLQMIRSLGQHELGYPLQSIDRDAELSPDLSSNKKGKDLTRRELSPSGVTGALMREHAPLIPVV